MSQLDTAQALIQMMTQSDRCPTPDQMRALQLPALDRLSDQQLDDLGDLLKARLRAPGVQAMVREITPQIFVNMLSKPSAVDVLLKQVAERQRAVRDVVHAVEKDEAFSLEVRSAFGLLTSLHADRLRDAIRHGEITQAELLHCVDDGAGLTAILQHQPMPVPLSFETLLDTVGNRQRAVPELGVESPVEVIGHQGQFKLMVSNGYELWRGATFLTQEPETVAWLDETFQEGDCLYDIGANIGLYSLYALAKTQRAQAVCFEPDPINYYRLSANVVANGFGPRAILFPMAVSDTVGLGAFNSSLFVAGKAENWISPGADLLGQEPSAGQAQPAPTLRTGCPTFHLDGLIEQAGFLPSPTHLKIDVDSVEIEILRGAQQTLQSPTLCHVLVELYERELEVAQDILAAAGFRYIRSVEQQNVLPCYEEFLGNHIFAKER
ncbi:MAG: hypothetical protein ETSY1_03810 [Candidatus Entotheonella factor]|uniref:Methyltransferase FkbM domain-containing protein n=1 Tax=Entotheonella factor TaxID=1429438 RepID=W4LXA0_ENTF1|nr:FkbM family methyltransferase [Candidatus Entotheonella palauensis]ETX02361.1 MAG: hypothetical protein ETSY1_03810 [Candidatus Entotheonella factor]